jgi:cysteine-rich repeat protein
VVRAGVEQCDDGNAVNTDACLNTCVAAACGDGVVRAGVEQCDDGNAVNTDACLNTCVAASCGDGVVRAGVEQCDDGNTVDTDACLTTCVSASCGDGVVEAGVEACDGDAPRACATDCGTTGSQACVACFWDAACTPPAESCNGIDDDCNGVSDSAGLAFSGPTTDLPLYGNLSGGGLTLDACPAGEVVIGVSGVRWNGLALGQLQVHCGLPSVACAGGTCTASVATGTLLPLHGGLSADGDYSALCPADNVVVGFRGRYTDLVTSLVIRCAPLVVTPAWALEVGATTDLPEVGYGFGTDMPQTDCPAGEIATVAPIRSGSLIDAFGLSCQAPALVCQ